MNELANIKFQLPATIEGLNEFILIGKERLKVHQAKIRAIEKVGMAEAARKAALQDGQDAGTAVIYAEAKLGELLAAIPNKPKPDGSPRGTFGGSEKSLPTGISKRTSHQAQTIAANPEKVEQIIATATAADKIPTPDMVYKLIKKGETQAARREMVSKIPSGKFAVIYADPPWQYSNSGFNESAESQYSTMPTEDICKMSDEVEAWSTPETVLFLWATNPLLPDALEVMQAWGFDYKTNMAWIKDKGRGKGWFLQSKHELLLIGTRANTPHPNVRPDSCFEADRGPVHSRKPEIVYGIIESMYDGAKLEMFCRNPREGWEAHGNEL